MAKLNDVKKRYNIAKADVTTVHPVLNLERPAPIVSCINVFERVVGCGVNEQSDFTLDCEQLRHGEFCKHTKCEWYAKHMEYVIAADAYAKKR